MKIINFGSLNIDYVYSAENIVKKGETIASYSLEQFPGGKGLNQSIAIARAGGRATHAGMYSHEGQFLHDILLSSGVDVSKLKKMNAANGHAIIQVDSVGENSIVLFAGTNDMIDEEYIDTVLSGVTGDEIILFQNETSGIAIAMKKAKELGCKIAINPAPMNKKVMDYPLDLVDIFVVNLTEGQRLSSQIKPSKILDALCEKYPKAKVILTLGSKGSWYSKGEEKFFIKANKVRNVVDTTAAGDTFIGYYLANISTGMSDHKALLIATQAAAICITRKGAAVSIPHSDELKL